jgi:PAS domain-containing protein
MVLNQRAVFDELNDAVIVHDVHDNQIIDVNQQPAIFLVIPGKNFWV